MNILDYFEEQNIEFWESGKNVSPGWVNICCPFCDDQSNHCGIKLSSLSVSCWRCGGHNIINLVRNLSHCSKQEAKKIKRRISVGTTMGAKRGRPEASSACAKYTKLPIEATRDFPEIHTKYLRSRGFIPPEHFINKYRLQASYTIGRYRFRIIIPIYMDNKLCTFTSRTIIRDQELSYLSASPKESTTNIKSTIYNYDNLPIGTDAIVVEGPADVWKLGDGAVSILGVKYTDRQVVLLKRKKIKTLFVFFDHDRPGKTAAEELSKVMAPLVRKVEIITVKGLHDPGDLNLDDANILKYQLGFKGH